MLLLLLLLLFWCLVVSVVPTAPLLLLLVLLLVVFSHRCCLTGAATASRPFAATATARALVLVPARRARLSSERISGLGGVHVTLRHTFLPPLGGTGIPVGALALGVDVVVAGCPKVRSHCGLALELRNDRAVLVGLELCAAVGAWISG